MKAMLSPQEVAERLGVSRATVYAWAREGNLSSHRLGPRTLRFEEEEVESLAKRDDTDHNNSGISAEKLLLEVRNILNVYAESR